jgi:hypothetical protein
MTAVRAARRWTARTLRHCGDVISQEKRKRGEEIFGWINTVANFRRSRCRGHEFTLVGSLPGRRRL